MVFREEQNRRQLELLQSLVEGVQLQGEAATKRAENDRDVKVPKLTENDDIVSYLTMFERLMVAYEVKREKWVFKLAAHLVGKAQEAYAALSLEESRDYERVKGAILRRFDITEDSYRQQQNVSFKDFIGQHCTEMLPSFVDVVPNVKRLLVGSRFECHLYHYPS